MPGAHAPAPRQNGRRCRQQRYHRCSTHGGGGATHEPSLHARRGPASCHVHAAQGLASPEREGCRRTGSAAQRSAAGSGAFDEWCVGAAFKKGQLVGAVLRRRGSMSPVVRLREDAGVCRLLAAPGRQAAMPSAPASRHTADHASAGSIAHLASRRRWARTTIASAGETPAGPRGRSAAARASQCAVPRQRRLPDSGCRALLPAGTRMRPRLVRAAWASGREEARWLSARSRDRRSRTTQRQPGILPEIAAEARLASCPHASAAAASAAWPLRSCAERNLARRQGRYAGRCARAAALPLPTRVSRISPRRPSGRRAGAEQCTSCARSACRQRDGRTCCALPRTLWRTLASRVACAA
jgi:hypothetical protein